MLPGAHYICLRMSACARVLIMCECQWRLIDLEGRKWVGPVSTPLLPRDLGPQTLQLFAPPGPQRRPLRIGPTIYWLPTGCGCECGDMYQRRQCANRKYHSRDDARICKLPAEVRVRVLCIRIAVSSRLNVRVSVCPSC